MIPLMHEWLIRSAQGHTYGVAWQTNRYRALLFGGCLLVLLLGYLWVRLNRTPRVNREPPIDPLDDPSGASRAEWRPTPSRAGILLDLWFAVLIPVAYAKFAPPEFSPLVDLLLGSDARSAKVFEDVTWTLLVLNLVVLAFAAATVTAALRRMSLAPEKMLLLAPCVLVMSLFVLWHSTMHIQRLTCFRMLPRLADYTHPIHVGYEFKPAPPIFTPKVTEPQPTPPSKQDSEQASEQTSEQASEQASETTSEPKRPWTPEDATTDGWTVKSPAITVRSPGETVVHVRYEHAEKDFFVESDVHVTAKEERGEPLFSPQLGDRWFYADVGLRIADEQTVDGLHYFEVHVDRRSSKRYFIRHLDGFTLLWSEDMKPLGSLLHRTSKPPRFLAPDHVPCEIPILERTDRCACSTRQLDPFRPGGLVYCEGIRGKASPRRSTTDQIGEALFLMFTGGLGALALPGENDGHVDPMVLTEFSAMRKGPPRYTLPPDFFTPDARRLGSSTVDAQYRVAATNAFIAQSRHLMICGKGFGTTQPGQITLLFAIDKEGKVQAAVTTASTFTNFQIDECAAQAARNMHFPRPPGGAVLLEITRKL